MGKSQTLKDYLYSLGFKVDEAGAKRFTDRIEKVKRFTVGLAVATAGAAAAAAKSIQATAESMAPLSILAKEANTTADAISRISFEAEQLGSNTAAAESSVKNLANMIRAARLGEGQAIGNFQSLPGGSIRYTDETGEARDTMEVMDDIRERMRGMNEEQARFFMARFGIDASLYRTMTEDVSKLEAQFKRMQEATGLSFNQATQDSEAFSDALQRVMTITNMVWKAAVSKFLKPAIEQFDQFTELIIDSAPDLVENIGFILKALLEFGMMFFRIGLMVTEAVSSIVGWLRKMDDASNGALVKGAKFAFILLSLAVTVMTVVGKIMILKAALVKAKVAMAGLSATMMANPIGLIVAAIVALIGVLYLLYNDWKTFKRGGDSFFDWSEWEEAIKNIMPLIKLLGHISKVHFLYTVGPAIAAIGPILKFIMRLIGLFVQNSLRLFNALAAMLRGDFSGAWEHLMDYLNSGSEFWEYLIELITGVYNNFKQLATYMFEGLGPAFAQLEKWGERIGKVFSSSFGVIDKTLGAAGDFFGFGGDDEDGEKKTFKPKNFTPRGMGHFMAPAHVGGSNVHQENKTEVHIHESANPRTTANEVAKRQDGVNQRATRNLKGRLR